MIINGNT